MTMLDLPLEHPMSKRRRRALIALAAMVVCGGVLWYMLRFHTERTTVRQFLNAVVSGNMQQAYQIWKPAPSYSFKDFLEDWGPDGYYGPVRSYRIEHSEHPPGGSAVKIKVALSPDQPFPADDDAAKQNKI